jgi:hypothetical protein
MGTMHLVTGPFRPALEAAFRETFASLRRDDPLAPIAVIASQRLSDRLKGSRSTPCPKGFAAVRFFNLFSFARTLYEESAAAGFTLLLDDLVPERLLRAILQRHFAEERYLSRALLAPSSLLGALHKLKAGGVDPGKALAALAEEELGYEDAPSSGNPVPLQALRGRAPPAEIPRAVDVRLAAEHAPRSAILGGFKHVLYYGFYDLDQNQLDLLREVRRRVPAPSFSPTSKPRATRTRRSSSAPSSRRWRTPSRNSRKRRLRRACRRSPRRAPTTKSGPPRRRSSGSPTRGFRTSRSGSSPGRSIPTST